jgi:hypothetical protein
MKKTNVYLWSRDPHDALIKLLETISSCGLQISPIKIMCSHLWAYSRGTYEVYTSGTSDNQQLYVAPWSANI